MSKTKTIPLSDLLPGEGGRGRKTGVPRLGDTKLSGVGIVQRAMKNTSGQVVIPHEDIIAIGRAKLAEYGEANGVRVEASDDEVRKLFVTNFTTAARQAAKREGVKLTIKTNAQTKSGKGRVIVEVAG